MQHFEAALATINPSTNAETGKYYESMFKEMKTAMSKKSEKDLGLSYYR
jgi:hypothetical protein